MTIIKSLLIILMLQVWARIFGSESRSEWALTILNTLSLEQKIAQLCMVGVSPISDATQSSSTQVAGSSEYDYEYIQTLVKEYGIGGIIFLGHGSAYKQYALTQYLQKMSPVPLLIAQDCEWGLSMRLDACPETILSFPKAMTLAATANEELITAVAHEIGLQCKALGIHMNFAPVADVNTNKYNPIIHMRSFGDNPTHVARYAVKFSQGLQSAGILACGKHFPGHGDTSVDSHLGLPVLHHDRHRLETIEFEPFRGLINANVAAIMTGHLSVPCIDTQWPASLSHACITNLLKHHLHFDGICITDALNMKAITTTTEKSNAVIAAFLAGNDILLCPDDVHATISALTQACSNGTIMLEDIDARVLKILQIKERFLTQTNFYQEADPLQFIIRPEARALQRVAYKAAVTLVQSSYDITWGPDLFSRSCLISCGSSAHNYFKQEANTLFKTMHNATCLDDESIVASLASYPLVVFALHNMHNDYRKQFGIPDKVLNVIPLLQKKGTRVMALLFGTPYACTLMRMADAIVVAYEDCQPMHESVIELLMGTLQPQGRLPIQCDF